MINGTEGEGDSPDVQGAVYTIMSALYFASKEPLSAADEKNGQSSGLADGGPQRRKCSVAANYARHEGGALCSTTKAGEWNLPSHVVFASPNNIFVFGM